MYGSPLSGIIGVLANRQLFFGFGVSAKNLFRLSTTFLTYFYTGLGNKVADSTKQVPSRDRQNRQARAGTNFTKPRTYKPFFRALYL